MTSRLITRLVPYIAAVTLALTGMQAFAATATITPSQDNTLAEELPDNSSGACDSIFSGNIDDQAVPGARRALIQFDIAGQIPPGSTITSVTLSMAVTRGSNHVDSTFYLHPVTVPWVEGVEGCSWWRSGRTFNRWGDLDYHEQQLQCDQQRRNARKQYGPGLGQYGCHGR